jgi:hypothetical protein
MNRALTVLLLTSSLFASSAYQGDTTAVVTLVGGIMKSESVVIDKKYPRKSCPVCKGTGKYISGDGIKQVDCGYCDPNIKSEQPPQCSDKECTTRSIKK